MRAAVEAGASAYRNEIPEQWLEMSETPGLVETIAWLGRHHAARGDRLDVIGAGEEVAGTRDPFACSPSPGLWLPGAREGDERGV